MKVRWSETALAELEDIFSYIHRHNRSAASAVVERIEGLTALLEEFPLVGHLTDEADVRVLSVVRYPFLIFYATMTRLARSSSCTCATPRKNGRNSRREFLAARYSAAFCPGFAACARPTNPVASPKHSTMTAGRSLVLWVTQAPERTA